jgi:hypothetical protein
MLSHHARLLLFYLLLLSGCGPSGPAPLAIGTRGVVTKKLPAYRSTADFGPAVKASIANDDVAIFQMVAEILVLDYEWTDFERLMQVRLESGPDTGRVWWTITNVDGISPR